MAKDTVLVTTKDDPEPRTIARSDFDEDVHTEIDQDALDNIRPAVVELQPEGRKVTKMVPTPLTPEEKAAKDRARATAPAVNNKTAAQPQPVAVAHAPEDRKAAQQSRATAHPKNNEVTTMRTRRAS